MNRTMARAQAMKLVYEWEMGGNGGEDTRFDLLGVQPGEEESDYMEALFEGVIRNIEGIDRQIARYAHGWSIERINRVDLAILRVAVYELAYCKLSAAATIAAALEVADKYSTEKSVAFINGVLGTIARGEKA